MSERRATRSLLDELAADAPVERMRSRLERLVADPPRARRRPATWLGWAAAAAAALAVLVVALRSPAPAPGGPDAEAQAVIERLEAPSAFDRLAGVFAAAELPERSWAALHPVLFERLESDPSVNVRLSALDVLVARGLPAPSPDRLVEVLVAQPTDIVQAHLGHELRSRRLLSGAELERLLARPEIRGEARRALAGREES